MQHLSTAQKQAMCNGLKLKESLKAKEGRESRRRRRREELGGREEEGGGGEGREREEGRGMREEG